MTRIPTVKTFMTAFPYSVEIDAPVDEALQFMRDHKIRHLPVTENGQLKGVISDRDIKLMLGPDFAYPDAHEMKVKEAMVEDAYVVDFSTPLDTVLSHMAEHRIGSALITRKAKLVGVFTSSDACRAFAEFLANHYRPPSNDTAA